MEVLKEVEVIKFEGILICLLIVEFFFLCDMFERFFLNFNILWFLLNVFVCFKRFCKVFVLFLLILVFSSNFFLYELEDILVWKGKFWLFGLFFFCFFWRNLLVWSLWLFNRFVLIWIVDNGKGILDLNVICIWINVMKILLMWLWL